VPLLTIDTASPETGLPFASVTLAVAVEVDLPSAVIDDGLKFTATLTAGPAVCVNVAVPETIGLTDESAAVRVEVPAVVVEVIVAL
jgi:hypothetical protein